MYIHKEIWGCCDVKVIFKLWPDSRVTVNVDDVTFEAIGLDIEP
jgi:hypothetical protein